MWRLIFNRLAYADGTFKAISPDKEFYARKALRLQSLR